MSSTLNIFEQMNSLKSQISAFQETQEKRLLKFDYSTTSTSSNKATSSTSRRVPHSGVVTNSSIGANSLHLKRFLEVDVLISPSYIQSKKAVLLGRESRTQGWPQGLIANLKSMTADISSIESLGSVWRISERADFPGVKKKYVTLQSVEIGVGSSYLTKALTLSARQEEAAVWEVNATDSTITLDTVASDPNPNPFFDLLDKQKNCMSLQFKLIEDVSSDAHNSSSAARYLVAVSSNPLSTYALGLVTLETLKAQVAVHSAYSYAVGWDVIPEEAQPGGYADIEQFAGLE